MTDFRTNSPVGWPEFYDPDLYEQKIGPGLRVGDAYTEFLPARDPVHVAEYGCGPGEIVISLARAGHYVVGIDRAEKMVARARLRLDEEPDEVSARVLLLHGSVHDLALPQPVDAVLMPNEFVLHLLDAPALVETFAAAWLNIAKRGKIILDIPIVDFGQLAQASGPLRHQEFCRGYFSMRDGTTLRVSERVVFSTKDWRKEMVFKYERIDADGRGADAFFRRLVQRVWTTQEVCFALQLTGADRIEVRNIDGFPDRVFILAERGTT